MSLRADVALRRGSLELRCALEADSRGIVVLLGPNGAGKTTLLRVLAGLLPLESGRVELDGRVLEDSRGGAWVPPEQRQVAVVFQEVLLFPHLCALDNVAFGLRSRGIDASEARRRAAAWLERLDLGPVARHRPRALSGGQAQRVALARALITEPRLLLLDEPLASVDASARVELRRALRAHLADLPAVRLLVTHDPLEAAALSERVIVLEGGRVVQEGDFADVTARPRSEWTARMAGVNLLRGEAAQGSLRLSNGARIAFTGPAAGPVLATIHPRAVALHRVPMPGSPRNVLSCAVAGVDQEGDRWRIRLDGPVPLVAEVTSAAAAELRLAEGGDVYASIKATEVDVYPA